MLDIISDTNGILKLLANLKTDKASGPDEIKTIVLKELRNEISPVIIHVIFSWTQIGRFGFTDREIGSQIGRFFRGKKYSILMSKNAALIVSLQVFASPTCGAMK